MKIVFFQIVTNLGGSSRSLVEFASRLRVKAEVEIVDIFGGCEPFAEAVRNTDLPYRVLLPGQGLRAVGSLHNPFARVMKLLGTGPMLRRIGAAAGRLFAEIQPTVVLANDFRSLLPLELSRKCRSVPLAVHLRGWWTPDMLTAYCRWLANRRCAALLPVSHQTATALACRGVDPRKCHVLHNPIDVAEFEARAAQPLLGPLPQADRPVRLLLPGTIIRTKGQHTAVAAMKRLQDHGHDAVLWIAGDINDATRPYQQKVAALAEQLGVAERVEWLGLRKDIPQLMQAATAVVLPTYTEGHPRVCLEAFALAKPFVATPAGGILDMVLPGQTGLLFEIDDDQALAECIERLIAEPELGERIGRRAKQYVLEEFRPEQQIDRAIRIFESIANPGAAR